MTHKVNHAAQSVYSSASYGEKPSSWQNPPQGPTLSASQQHFIKLMGCIEYRESEQTIEALKLPKDYKGKQIMVETNIQTESQWFETLHQLLDELEKETIKSFADSYISALFSYVFTSVSVKGRKKPPISEEHHGP